MDSLTKKHIRNAASKARAVHTSKDHASQTILQRLLEFSAFRAAQRVAFYVHVRDEVRTLDTIAQLLATPHGKEVSVPFCHGDELKLISLKSIGDLEAGRFGILEPRAALRKSSDRQVGAHEIDLFIVPGVAFDRDGCRLGHGMGFYDRLLETASPESGRVGLAFDCQLVERVPTDPHDIAMHWVLTETQTITGQCGLAANATYFGPNRGKLC